MKDFLVHTASGMPMECPPPSTRETVGFFMPAIISGWLAPLLAPLGLGDWRISTSLIAGFIAKESVVSTISILFGSTEAMVAVLSPLAALSLLVFCLLYTPCVAAVAAVRRELGGTWAMLVVLGQCMIAWIAAFVVRYIGILLGM